MFLREIFLVLCCCYHQVISATIVVKTCSSICDGRDGCIEKINEQVTKTIGHLNICYRKYTCFNETYINTDFIPVQQKPINIAFGQQLYFNISEFQKSSINFILKQVKTYDNFRSCNDALKTVNYTYVNNTIVQLHISHLSVGIHYFIFESNSIFIQCRFGFRLQLIINHHQCNLDGKTTCSNHGACLLNKTKLLYECQCCHPFTGALCHEYNSCNVEVDPCVNNGTCVDLLNGTSPGFTCSCDTQFTGKLCEYCKNGYKPPECIIDLDECNTTQNICNYGDCVNTDGSFYCLCPVNVTGKLCAVDLYNNCLSSPCNISNQTCVDRYNGFSCQCPVNFTGSNCETSLNMCLNHNCYIEGTKSCSIDGDGASTCNCLNGYSGQLCENNINECDPNPCKNGSYCIDGLNSYQCICLPDFDGKHCDKVANKCKTPIPCKNNSTCDRSGNNLRDYICRCLPGWKGKNCDQLVKFCNVLSPCLNNGTCTDIFNNYTCHCKIGWTGRNCTKNYNACENKPCQNNASCIDSAQVLNYTCICRLGFTGKNCSVNIDDCVGVNCSNGFCIDLVNNSHCECSNGWYGKHCDVDQNYCAKKPCANSISCENVNIQPGYRCNCKAGFTGSNCIININDCSNHSCHNGGVCQDYVNFYNCSCPPGFEGSLCEIDINECGASPCQNNATCHELTPNQYFCQCLPGFSGQNCEENIDECSRNPCKNNGACIDGINNYTCICPIPWTGRFCESHVNLCNSTLCLHNSTCLWHTDNNTYVCLCSYPYSGLNCDNHICNVTKPCNNGTCFATSTNYSCQCNSGFTSHDCSMDIDECNNDLCMNNGSCVNEVGSYHCRCSNKYTGFHCENILSYCNSTTCNQHGRCTNDYGDRKYQCQCDPDYTGGNCESKISICFNQTCNSNGVCLDHQNGTYKCDCFLGFSGNHCEAFNCPCQYGRCIMNTTTRSYQCLCQAGYTGRYCEDFSGDCRNNSKQCSSNTFCALTEFGYICQCPSHLQGEFCRQPANCVKQPCKNNGTCNSTATGTAFIIECNCQPGFTGNFCEFDINECALSPCQSNGTCVDAINSFQCFCPDGIIGSLCDITIAHTAVLSTSASESYTPILPPSTTFASLVYSSHVENTSNITVQKTISTQETIYASDQSPSTMFASMVYSSHVETTSKISVPKTISTQEIPYSSIQPSTTIPESILYPSSVENFSKVTETDRVHATISVPESSYTSIQPSSTISESILHPSRVETFSKVTETDRVHATISVPESSYTSIQPSSTISASMLYSSHVETFSKITETDWVHATISVPESSYTSIQPSSTISASMLYSSHVETFSKITETDRVHGTISVPESSYTLIQPSSTISASMLYSSHVETFSKITETDRVHATISVPESSYTSIQPSSTISASMLYSSHVETFSKITETDRVHATISVPESSYTSIQPSSTISASMLYSSHVETFSKITETDRVHATISVPESRYTSIQPSPTISASMLYSSRVEITSIVVQKSISTQENIYTSIQSLSTISASLVYSSHVENTSKIKDTIASDSLLSTLIQPTAHISVDLGSSSVQSKSSSIRSSTASMTVSSMVRITSSDIELKSVTSAIQFYSKHTVSQVNLTSTLKTATKHISPLLETSSTNQVGSSNIQFNSTTIEKSNYTQIQLTPSTLSTPPFTASTPSSIFISTYSMMKIDSSLHTMSIQPSSSLLKTASSSSTGINQNTTTTTASPTTTMRPFMNLTCLDEPCNSFICINETDHGLSFRCVCPFPTLGPRCTLGSPLHYPRFNGHSYIELPSIKTNSTSNLSATIVLHTVHKNGLLLYARHETFKDFIEIYLFDGFVHAMVNTGMETIKLKSRTIVNDGSTVAVELKVNTRHATLQVNQSDVVSKAITSNLKSIELTSSWFLGGLPDNLSLISTKENYVGCMKELVINGIPSDLNNAANWTSISDCDVSACERGVCKNNARCITDYTDLGNYECICEPNFKGPTCQMESIDYCGDQCNGGKCVWTPTTGKICLCQYGRSGPNCLKDLTISSPHFSTVLNYSSYIEYPWLKTGRYAKERFEIRFQFKLSGNDSMKNSLLVYMGQSAVGALGDDFFAVGIIDTFVCFLYDLGSGLTMLRSHQQFNVQRSWHFIVAGRTKQHGYLYVNSQPKVEAISSGVMTSLDVYTPLYLGGVPEFNKLPGTLLVYFRQGFTGLIQDVAFRAKDSTYIPLLFYTEAQTSANMIGVPVATGLNIKNDGQSSCETNPCMNNGTCEKTDSGYRCICQSPYQGMLCNDKDITCIDYNPCSAGSSCRSDGFTVRCDCPYGKIGTFCERDLTVTVPRFATHSYLSVSAENIRIRSKLILELKFNSNQPNGLLFYVAHKTDSAPASGDFFAISLWKRYVYVRFNLGYQTASMRSRQKISMNRWHTLYVRRESKDAIMRLDRNNFIGIRSSGSMSMLDVSRAFFVGGVPLLSNINIASLKDVQSQRDFTGCINSLKVNGHKFNLSSSHPSNNGRNLLQCHSSCLINRCRNNALCTPALNATNETAPETRYMCECPVGYFGNWCDNDTSNMTTAFFATNSYYFTRMNEIGKKPSLTLKLRFKTKLKDGLVLWSSRLRESTGDHLGIGIVDGRITVSYQLGKKSVSASTDKTFNDDEFHEFRLYIVPSGVSSAILFVVPGDQPKIISNNVADGNTKQIINTDGYLYIGGLPGNVSDLTGGRFKGGFHGCLSDVVFSFTEKPIDFSVKNFAEGINIGTCSD